MARLERVTHKLFAENAPVVESGNTSVEIGQFGSALAGTYVATNDVATLQALPAYSRGWGGAVIADEQLPTLEDMNAVQRVQSYQTGYLFQEGIAEYDADTEYGVGSLCKVINGENITIYQSVTQNNIGFPVTDTNAWKLWKPTEAIELPVFCANSGNVDENGNADLLYLPEMGKTTIPFTFSGTLTKTGGISITNNTSNIYLSCWTDGSGGRTGSFELVFANPIGSPATFETKWTGQANARLVVNLVATFDDDTTETIFNKELNGGNGQYSTTATDKKITKISASLNHYYTSNQYSGAHAYIYPISETVDISTSTSCYFKVGGDYPKLVATSTEKTFEMSYLEPITAETDGTYNVFVSETENAYALANAIYKQKAEPSPKFVQPVLSANGTMGGNSFAVSSNVEQYGSNAVYSAFDGNTSSTYGFHSISGTKTGYIDIYNPIALNITNFKIYNQNYANRASSAGIIYGSNDGAEWTQITTYTNSVQTASSSWNIDLSSNDNYYKYYRIESTAGGSDSYWVIIEVQITATQAQNQGDVWLNTSVQPYKAYEFNGTSWVNFNDVPIGSMVVSGGVITSAETFAYNQIIEKEEITSWGFPSNRYINLSLGATNSTYIAPANGWFSIARVSAGAGNYISMTCNNVGSQVIAVTSGQGLLANVPATKGATLSVGYNGGSLSSFRFVYAEGEE